MLSCFLFIFSILLKAAVIKVPCHSAPLLAKEWDLAQLSRIHGCAAHSGPHLSLGVNRKETSLLSCQRQQMKIFEDAKYIL